MVETTLINVTLNINLTWVLSLEEEQFGGSSHAH